MSNANWRALMSTARTFGATALGWRQNNIADRPRYEAMLSATLAPEKNWFGAWGTFEPNTFDGKDAEFRQSRRRSLTSVKSNGRYVPYAYRDGDKHRASINPTISTIPPTRWITTMCRKKPAVCM